MQNEYVHFPILPQAPSYIFGERIKRGATDLMAKKAQTRSSFMECKGLISPRAPRSSQGSGGDAWREGRREDIWIGLQAQKEIRWGPGSPWSLRHLITRLWRNKGKLNLLRKQVKMIVIVWCSILAALKPRRYFFFQVIQKKTIKPWNQGKSRFQNLISSNKISGAPVNYRRQIWLPYWKILQSSIYAD